MGNWALLSIAVAGAMALAACTEDVDSSSLTGGTDSAIVGKRPAAATPGTKIDPVTGKVLPNVTAKEYFATTLHLPLSQACGGCHAAAGTGPAWISPTEVNKAYALQFERGYVSRTSALLQKGTHAGPSLNADQQSKYATWVALELFERGDKAPDTVFAKLADCLDEAKFTAIGFDKLLTVTRAEDNNPGKQAEDADTCSGCKPVQCSACHSADAASGFIMAIGNDIFDANHTFTETKSSKPPYLQKYFGLDVNGAPIASKALKAKSDNTVKIAKAYGHPMFVLAPEMDKAINAFVDDAIAKFKAGTCAKK